ncbi:WxL domain-containing protein [Lactococcus kimchii]|uniref:WxL domain-containing protein n=1 Tax=Lactococcus sp. S-13 TaxID=2507158 RepID=UPI0010231014|nr:WxL domain-containing protein [Lactococcus sp. S-13]RZI49396.1 WxL domain-containing protein [Lactococcus sp. S-13]
MKKTFLLSVPLFLMILGATVQTDADTVAYQSDAKIGFTAGSGTTPPVDPNQPDPTDPVSPENPDGSKPAPGGNGTLTIDFASSFDFGTHSISHDDQTYLAKAQKYFQSNTVTPDYVQVTDLRGTAAGWTLKVIEESQFKEQSSGPNKYPELKGASISLKNPTPASDTNQNAPATQEVLNLLPNTETTVAHATSGQGAGTWVIRWGDQSSLQTQDGTTFTPNVTLFVPGSSPKDAAAYTTSLRWLLSDLPANK